MDKEVPWKGTPQDALRPLSKKVADPYCGTTQFYCTGKARVSLAGGTYKLRAFKGTEYRVTRQEIRVAAGGLAEVTITMKRWANMPKEGWYGADPHLHIARPVKELNPIIAKWMQGEDIHVATLLQWGNSKRFHNAPQYAFGKDGLYREGDYLLASGQENPRTDFLGHTLILGSRTPINFPDKYLIYNNFWEEARRQQALSGSAHGGMFANAQAGLAVDLPDGFPDFIEVMQFDRDRYAVWYDMLNSGFRVTPVASTDYPCRTVLPGRERFYTQVEGPLSYESWLKGIKEGKTFVSNGPVLEFKVNNQGIGSNVALQKPDFLLIKGRVRFDPDRDDVDRLEVIENGDLIRTFRRDKKSAEIAFQFKHQVLEAAWFAIRTWGTKRGERGTSPIEFVKGPSPSLAHSGAIYVRIANQPGLAGHRRAKLLAGKWLEQLEALEKRLADPDRFAQLGSAGVEAAYIKKNREELLKRIQAARRYFTERRR